MVLNESAICKSLKYLECEKSGQLFGLQLVYKNSNNNNTNNINNNTNNNNTANTIPTGNTEISEVD